MLTCCHALHRYSHAHPEVQKDLLAFGEWIVKLLSLKGFRMDAVQHVRGWTFEVYMSLSLIQLVDVPMPAFEQFSQDFTNNFMDMLETEFGKGSLLAIGEVFDTNVDVLTNWLSKMVCAASHAHKYRQMC